MPTTSNQIRVLLDGKEYHPPKEWEDVEVLATFENETQANITTDDFSFILDAYTLLKQKKNEGLTGGPGIFSPVPIRIEAYNNTSTYAAFEGGVILKDAIWNDEEGEVKAPIQKESGLNTLDTRLSGLTYLFLYEKGIITDSDFFDVEYVVDKPDKGEQALLISITVYSLTRELIDLARQLGKDIAIISGLAASGFTGPAGSAIYTTASIIVNLAYSVAMIALITDLTADLIKMFALPVRIHKGIMLKKLLEKPLEWLGYGFDTSIPELDNLVYLPSNNILDVSDNNKGFLKEVGTIKKGLPHPTDVGYICNEIFAICKNLFNARYQVVNNTVQFHTESSPYWIKNSTYDFPDILEGPFRYNTDELQDSIFIKLATDLTDQYTIDEYKGTSFQVITEGINTVNGKDNIDGLDEVQIPLALASRKDSLNGLERALFALALAVDLALSSLGASSNLSSQIWGKVGTLRVSQNNHAIPKLIYYDGNRIPSNHRDLFSAKTLWDNYHSYKSFIEGNYQRQRKVYEDVEIPFGFADFLALIENSYFNYQGRNGKFTRLVWNMAQDKAKASFWVEEIYTRNLKETTIEPTNDEPIVTTR